MPRRRELLRITADNQAILKRIQVRLALPDAPCLGGRVDLKAGSCAQERQPFYNHLEWERERLQNEKYLRSGNRAAHLCPWLWASARSSLTAGLLFAQKHLAVPGVAACAGRGGRPRGCGTRRHVRHCT